MLPSFNESQESVLGYQLCLQLLQKGRKLYVTSTSTAECLEVEAETAEQLTRQFPGSITVVPIQEIDFYQPELHSESYKNLYQLQHVGVMIGMLPGTTRAILKLKQVLGCKLVLLVTTKLPAGQEHLTDDLSELAKRVKWNLVSWS